MGFHLLKSRLRKIVFSFLLLLFQIGLRCTIFREKIFLRFRTFCMFFLLQKIDCNCGFNKKNVKGFSVKAGVGGWSDVGSPQTSSAMLRLRTSNNRFDFIIKQGSNIYLFKNVDMQKNYRK